MAEVTTGGRLFHTRAAATPIVRSLVRGTMSLWRETDRSRWSASDSSVQCKSLARYCRTAAAGTFLRFFQTIFENTSIWRLKRLVSLSTYRRYINKCIYLSIYLSRWTVGQLHCITTTCASMSSVALSDLLTRTNIKRLTLSTKQQWQYSET